MDEVWKPVVTHPGKYEVSDQGRVRTVPAIVTKGLFGPQLQPSRILVQAVGGRAKNYKRVHLYHPERFAFVHHLVAEAFIGQRPEGLLVLHKNDDGFDNRLENLRYGDAEENQMDRHVARVAGGMEEAPF
jgi:hypothetical protein